MQGDYQGRTSLVHWQVVQRAKLFEEYFPEDPPLHQPPLPPQHGIYELRPDENAFFHTYEQRKTVLMDYSPPVVDAPPLRKPEWRWEYEILSEFDLSLVSFSQTKPETTDFPPGPGAGDVPYRGILRFNPEHFAPYPEYLYPPQRAPIFPAVRIVSVPPSMLWEPERYAPPPPPLQAPKTGYTFFLPDAPLPKYAFKHWMYHPEFVPSDIHWTAYAKTRMRAAAWPTSVQVSCIGLYHVYNEVADTLEAGQYRTQRSDQAGYIAYVGVDAYPEIGELVTPDAFSATLPFSIGYALPISDETLYVVVRYRDSYGCVSQNQRPYIINLTPGGVDLHDLAAPANVKAFATANNGWRVLATYPTYELDTDPATHWKVWINDSVEPIVSDPVANTTAVSGASISIPFGSGYAAGDYYIAVALFRDDDSAYSPLVVVEVTMPENPDDLRPVLSGYQDP